MHTCLLSSKPSSRFLILLFFFFFSFKFASVPGGFGDGHGATGAAPGGPVDERLRLAVGLALLRLKLLAAQPRVRVAVHQAEDGAAALAGHAGRLRVAQLAVAARRALAVVWVLPAQAEVAVLDLARANRGNKGGKKREKKKQKERLQKKEENRKQKERK